MSDDFDRGYACAVACIVNGHGACVATREALQANGLTSIAKLKKAGVDPYDLEILKPLVEEMERKNKTDNLPTRSCPECNRDMKGFLDYWKCDYCKSRWEPIPTEWKERGPCRDCGNKQWYDLSNSWVCTQCRKTHGKSSSEEDDGKPLYIDQLGLVRRQ